MARGDRVRQEYLPYTVLGGPSAAFILAVHGPGGPCTASNLATLDLGGPIGGGTDYHVTDPLSSRTISGSNDQMLKLPDFSVTLGVVRPKFAILLFLSDLINLSQKMHRPQK